MERWLTIWHVSNLKYQLYVDTWHTMERWLTIWHVSNLKYQLYVDTWQLKPTF
jgi:hypothetical protein